MLKLTLREVRPGMVLARTLDHPLQGDALLPSGKALTVADIVLLHEVGAFDLWVNVPALSFFDEFLTTRLSIRQHHMCETIRSALCAQIGNTTSGNLTAQHQEGLMQLVAHVLGGGRAEPMFLSLSAMSESLVRHGMDVAYTAMLLGVHLDGYLVDQRKRLAGSYAKDVVSLGLGCLVHDIGETRLPEPLRESRRRHDDDRHEWQQHAELGFEMVRSQIDASAATVVLNHHQHFDGSGFPCRNGPFPPAGEQIHIFARLALVADTFVHLLRQDMMPKPTLCALWQIRQDPFKNWMDPLILKALLKIIPPFVPGMLVTLSDRRLAVVSKTDERYPCRPVVQILRGTDTAIAPAELIDLSCTTAISIQSVDGTDVSEYLFETYSTSVSPRTMFSPKSRPAEKHAAVVA